MSPEARVNEILFEFMTVKANVFVRCFWFRNESKSDTCHLNYSYLLMFIITYLVIIYEVSKYALTNEPTKLYTRQMVEENWHVKDTWIC